MSLIRSSNVPLHMQPLFLGVCVFQLGWFCIRGLSCFSNMDSCYGGVVCKLGEAREASSLLLRDEP